MVTTVACTPPPPAPQPVAIRSALGAKTRLCSGFQSRLPLLTPLSCASPQRGGKDTLPRGAHLPVFSPDFQTPSICSSNFQTPSKTSDVQAWVAQRPVPVARRAPCGPAVRLVSANF